MYDRYNKKCSNSWKNVKYRVNMCFFYSKFLKLQISLFAVHNICLNTAKLIVNNHPFLFNYLELYHWYKKSTYHPVSWKSMTDVRKRLSWKSDDRVADNGFNQSALANNNSLSEKLTFVGAPIQREKYRGNKTRRRIPRVWRKSAGDQSCGNAGEMLVPGGGRQLILRLMPP